MKVLIACESSGTVRDAFIREDGWQKLKIAAGMFPFRFFLCQKLAKKDGGKWSIKEI